MKTLLNRHFLLFALLVPLALGAEMDSADDVSNHSFVDEMLIKPSVIPMDDIEEPELLQSDAAQLKESQKQPDFLENLQANFGSINMPVTPQATEGGSPNTWIPKFVWLGDVKKSDDLKCFAAFLIGSLADKDTSTSQMSPGVFMTPTTTPSLSPQSKETIAAAIPEKQMDARSYRSAPPPPAPENSSMFSEFDAGLAFLYFAGYRGDLIAVPNDSYQAPTGISSTSGAVQSQPVRGPIEYNRTPIYTMDFGWRIARWIDFGATFQAQQGIHIRTQPFQFAYLSSSTPTLVTNHFESDLALYSMGGKLMFHWADMVNFANWSMELYFGGSGGAGWQSWTRVQAIQTYFNHENQTFNSMTNANISFRNQYYANFNYTGDAGFLFKPTSATSKMTFKMGCKFIGWGSARGIGDQKDQSDIFNNGSTATDGSSATTDFPGRVRPGYFKPIRIRTIYSWAPYIGFKLEF